MLTRDGALFEARFAAAAKLFLVGVAIVLALLVLPGGLGDLPGARSPSVILDDDVGLAAPRVGGEAHASGDWTACSQGLSLEPGGRGEVSYLLDIAGNEDLALRLWFYHAPEATETRVDLSFDGTDFRTVVENQHLAGTLIAAGRVPQGADKLLLRFSATASGSLEGSRLILDKVQVSQGRYVTLPNVPAMLATAAVALIAWELGRPFGIGLSSVLGGVALVVALLAQMPSLGPLAGAWVVDLAALPVNLDWLVPPEFSVFELPKALILPLPGLAASLVLWARRGRQERFESAVGLALLAGVIILGAALRWSVLNRLQLHALDPDAQGFASLAASMRYVYDTGFREPLWIWLIHSWSFIAGSSFLALRVLSFSLSVLVLPVTYWVFHRTTGRFGPALLAALFLAINPYLVYMSARGLRLEPYTLAVLLLAYYVLAPEAGKSRSYPFWLGFWGTMAVLLQINSLAFVLPSWLYALWRRRLPLKLGLLTLSVLLLLLTPHVVNNYRRFGDPLWSANVHAMWYRNYEFLVVKGSGGHGSPTLEEFQAAGHSGERTTTLDYVFGMRSLREAVTRTVRGYMQVFVTRGMLALAPFSLSIVLHWAYILGAILLLVSPDRGVLIFGLATLNLTAFLVPLGIDRRIVMHVAPFASFTLAWGVLVLVTLVRRAAAAISAYIRRSGT